MNKGDIIKCSDLDDLSEVAATMIELGYKVQISHLNLEITVLEVPENEKDMR